VYVPNLEEMVKTIPPGELMRIATRMHKAMQKKSKAKSWGTRGVLITPEQVFDKLRAGPWTCWWTGVVLFPTPSFGPQFDGTLNNLNRFQMTWDRIDPTVGYTVDNTVLCSLEFNRIKGSMTPKMLKFLCTKLNELHLTETQPCSESTTR
jgi:hypothetical protein